MLFSSGLYWKKGWMKRSTRSSDTSYSVLLPGKMWREGPKMSNKTQALFSKDSTLIIDSGWIWVHHPPSGSFRFSICK